MYKLTTFFLFLFLFVELNAQLVEVQANYNSIGDVEFIAYNNSRTPVFLNIDFADLENTTFNEPLPYVKLLEPGFNTLFILERDLDADVPRFNYQIKSFRSNPMAVVDLDFPYLFPFAPGTKVNVVDVKTITGFWGMNEPKSWNATGFKTNQGEMVCASRMGTVVEIVGANRTGEPENWYHTWNNSVTLLQPDGTLFCYRNVVDKNKKLKIGQKVFPGEIIGEIAPRETELLILIFQNSINTKDFLFIIPQFVTEENKIEMIITSLEYKVIHPDNIRGKEMTNKEKRKILNSKR